MRMIGTVPDETAAQRFGNFLLAQGVDVTVEQGSAGWQVWVHDDDKLASAAQELAAFGAAPNDQRYAAAAVPAKAALRERRIQERRLAKNFIDVRTHWSQAGHFFAPVTLALMAISCVVAWETDLGAVGPIVSRLLFTANIHGATEILHGQIWRLITPIFLHFSVLHLLFNMWFMVAVGIPLERRRGWLWYLGFVLLSGVISTTVQGLIYPYAGGMSGVGYALFGYVWMAGKFRPQEGLGISRDNVIIILGWMLLGFLVRSLHLGNYAHLSGLIVGVMIGYAPTGWTRLRRMMRQS
jgi:GlpG protein